MATSTGASSESTTGERFAALPPSRVEAGTRDPAFAVADRALILSAARPVRTWVESGWLGHIPLMFGIVRLHRPRRFVELGSHFGLSFFAACQVVQEDALTTECVAVDHWKGDSQAGYFDDSVFERFSSVLTDHYADFATYVRDDFDGAAARFQEGSIDLLHIDGFHSYEAVRHDFETWRSRLSDRGVVLFHDVNEHQADFGVWRFWRELEAEFPGRTVFFGHSHGLGLLSLDADPASQVNAFVTSCQDPDTLAFVQQYLTSVAGVFATYEGRLAEERERREADLYSVHVERQSELAQLHEEFRAHLAEVERVAQAETERAAESDARAAAAAVHAADAERLRDLLRDQAADHRLRLEELREEHDAELDELRRSRLAVEHHARELQHHHLAEMAELRRSFEQSRSWRATRALRAPARLVRRRRSPAPVAVAPEIRTYFSARWYARQSGLDLDAAAGALHYVTAGSAAGLSPHPLFDPTWYAEQLGDERPAEDLFVHYIRAGQGKSLSPHPLFDPERIRIQLGGDEAASARPFEHYLTAPGARALSPHDLFDGSAYLAANPDVDAAGLNPLVHYLESGEDERRRPNPDFEPGWYRAQYEDELRPQDSALTDFARRRSERGTLAAKAARRDHAVARLQEFLAGGRRPDLSSETPLVTVAIAVWNQAHFTLACLESLVDCSVPLRVVVVDNASTDSTAEMLARWKGVEVIRNSENLGFLEATNQVFAETQTPYVLLLNNDATVRPGAIERSLEVLEETGAGAVAAKVVLPNGLLQEAGSFLWSDASAQGYLRNEPWRASASMHRREVDFGSGAFLMMRTGPVKELGGLDEIYKPAYYEEVDLCMRLKRAGWPTIYDPSVIIDHVEFGSSPDKRNAIQLQIDHRHLVAERFEPELGRRPAPGSASADVLAGWATHDRPGVLLVDDRLPVGAEGSGLPRAEALTLALASGTNRQVLLAPMIEDPTVSWDAVRPVLERGVEVLPEYGERAMDRVLERLSGRFDTLVVSRFHNLLKLQALQERRPELFEGIRLVYDSEAVGVKRERLQAAINGRPWSNDRYLEMLEIEMSASRRADVVLAVSEGDAEAFREAGCADVRLVTHALETRPATAGPNERRGLLFVGRLNELESPNVDSVLWFLDNCLDELRARHGAGITVVGKTSREVMAELRRPGVLPRGTVADLDPVFDAARVFVAPTRFAAGTPIKVLTAAAAGVPVVSTSLLCEQLGWTPGVEIQVADTAEEFVERVGLLLTDDAAWTAQREAALARIERDFSMRAFVESITSFLDA